MNSRALSLASRLAVVAFIFLPMMYLGHPYFVLKLSSNGPISEPMCDAFQPFFSSFSICVLLCFVGFPSSIPRGSANFAIKISKQSDGIFSKCSNIISHTNTWP